MREDKHRRMVERIRSPPPFPGVVFPRPANGPKHIAPEDPRADIFERLLSQIVIDASRSAALAAHLLEYLGLLEPGV